MTSTWTYKGLKIPRTSKPIKKYSLCAAINKTDILTKGICYAIDTTVRIVCGDIGCDECILSMRNSAISIEYFLYKKYITKAAALDFMLRQTK